VHSCLVGWEANHEHKLLQAKTCCFLQLLEEFKRRWFLW